MEKNNKTKLSDLQMSIKTFWAILVAIAVLIAATFGAMNYYFAPREFVTKEIGVVKQDMSAVKADVKWIRKVWEEGIKKAEVIP